jgi:hypothetical protein
MGVGKRALAGVLAVGLLVATGTVQAALTVQANGTVYDSVQDISWDQDGNAVKTLCDDDDPIWQAFAPSAVANSSGRTKIEICADDGRLNWFEAEAWVAHLNAQGYKSITNWRQWAVTQPDVTCTNQTDDAPPQGFGYLCTGSEMGHLFNVAAPDGLENPFGDGCSPSCLQNTGPFDNFRETIYWAGTEFATNPAVAWNFDASNGYQFYRDVRLDQNYVWAVRPGPVGPPLAGRPEAIPAAGPFGIGLAGVLLLVVARGRLRS